MKDNAQDSYTIVFNTASEAQYREVMELGLVESSHGYFEDDKHADLYDLFDAVSGVDDSDHPRFIVSTSRIDEAKELLAQKTSVPFDILPGLVFKAD